MEFLFFMFWTAVVIVLVAKDDKRKKQIYQTYRATHTEFKPHDLISQTDAACEVYSMLCVKYNRFYGGNIKEGGQLPCDLNLPIEFADAECDGKSPLNFSMGEARKEMMANGILPDNLLETSVSDEILQRYDPYRDMFDISFWYGQLCYTRDAFRRWTKKHPEQFEELEQREK